MEIKKLLEKSIIEKFKAESVIRTLEIKICEIAEYKTFEKYKDTKFTADGLEFELIGVNADFCVFGIKIPTVTLKLAFAVSSKNKLPKIKRQKVESVIKDYKISKYKRLIYNNYKVALWKELEYDVELDEILSGNYNLNIP